MVPDVVTNTEYREAHKTLPIHRISNWNSAVIASGRISPEVCECELGSLKLMFERTSASQIIHIIGTSLGVSRQLSSPQDQKIALHCVSACPPDAFVCPPDACTLHVIAVLAALRPA